MGMQGDSRADLDKLTVKELRRQAALKNVPLQQIAVAVEKADLINLILRAGPVLDTYDAKIGVKVHSASSIAAGVVTKTTKSQKQKKKKRRHSSTSSNSSSSSSTRSRSRGRRRKRSRSRRRSRSKEKKKPALPERVRSRSPSLTVITPLPAARMRAARALPPPLPVAPIAAGKVSKPQPLPIADAAVDLEEDAVIPASTTEPPPPPEKQHQDKESAIVQAGVAAAAAMGFKLTKAPTKTLAAPALGLRPTVNAGARAAGPLADLLLPGAGARVCVEYLTTASCVLGDNCPDAHIIDPEEEMRVRAKFKEQECHSGALCNRPGCLFRHPGELLEKCVLATDSSSMSLRITGGTVRMEYK